MSGEEDIVVDENVVVEGDNFTVAGNNTWKEWLEENVIKWVAQDPYGFLYTVFLFLTPLFVISGILSWVLLKDIEKKDKEKKRKAKREANIAKARGQTRSTKPHPVSKKTD